MPNVKQKYQKWYIIDALGIIFAICTNFFVSFLYQYFLKISLAKNATAEQANEEEATTSVSGKETIKVGLDSETLVPKVPPHTPVPLPLCHYCCHKGG